MKNKKKILTYIINIILIIFINNIPFLKSIIFNYNNFHFQVLNANILISTFLLIIFFEIYIRKKFNKKTLIYLSTIIYCYNILSHLLSHFNAIGFVLLYLFIIFCSFITYLISKKEFEISLVTCVSIILLLFYLFGIFNILKFSWILIPIILIFGILTIIKNKNKNKNIIQIFQNEFFNKGLIIFSILFIIAILGGVGRFVHIWDEYSHWAYDAKITINLNQLSTYTGLIASTRYYSPILSIWHYFVSLFNNGFYEQNLYIGLSILIFIYMTPMFLYLKNKSNFFCGIFVIVIYAFNFIFDGAYSYSILYADLIMAFVCTSILIIYHYFKLENIENKYTIPFVISILTLIKPNGFVVSCSMLLLFWLIDYLDIKNKKLNLISFIKKWKWAIISIILTLLSWYICVYISKLFVNSYDFTLLPDSLKSSLKFKLNKPFLIKFFSSIITSFDEGITFSTLKLNLFPFIILIFSGIYYVNYINNKKDALKNTIPFILYYIVFFVLTLLSLFFMFSVYEAENIKSFGRYINCSHLVLINYILFVLCSRANINNKLYTKFLVILVIIISIIPFGKLTYFITDYNDRKNTETISLERINEFKIINEKTSKNSRIYIINQQDKNSIMTMWYTRYYTFPRYINASSAAINWKIKTESNTWDLQNWGLTADKLKTHLKNYKFDYLYLYSTDNEFFEKTKYLYTLNLDKVKEKKLFKIVNINNDLKLQPIK